jgi:N-succinyldiaminopimelate aminotransferase
MAFVDVGDEVVLFEPWYDSYAANVQLAGGVVKPVRLFPPQGARTTWWYDPEELAKAFSTKTRLVLVNTPHNPTGKVFTREELKEIGALAAKFGAVIVSDEVYEHLVFAPAKHVRTATIDGLDERTVTISSGGKTFSFTGWKVGWAIARPPLAQAIQKVHQWVTFASAHPFQAAIAKGLSLPDAYFHDFLTDYVHKRDFLAKALGSAGFRVLPCEGTYFLMADISSAGKADDLAFARWLTTEKWVVAIPPSAFYGDAHKAEARHLARFAFCKTQSVLDEAARRLAR